MAVIYQITNMVNGKYYIGSSQFFERRMWQHKYDLKRGCHKNPRLQAAWNKYGEDAFVFEVIEALPEGADQLVTEDIYLSQHVGRPECYNINTSAELMRLGVIHTDVAKAKMSAARKGKATGAAHYRYGTRLSDEVKAKISATQKGRQNPRKGLRMSEQGRVNVAAAVKRGEESHFYGKRPVSADKLQKTVYARKPDGAVVEYPSLTYMRDELGISIATTIRACKSGKAVRTGIASGWVMSYEPLESAAVPPEVAHLPRTRQLAKESGAPLYFTGEPCVNGHIAPRKTKGTCVECAKIEGRKSNERKKMAKLQAEPRRIHFSYEPNEHYALDTVLIMAYLDSSLDFQEWRYEGYAGGVYFLSVGSRVRKEVETAMCEYATRGGDTDFWIHSRVYFDIAEDEMLEAFAEIVDEQKTAAKRSGFGALDTQKR